LLGPESHLQGALISFLLKELYFVGIIELVVRNWDFKFTARKHCFH